MKDNSEEKEEKLTVEELLKKKMKKRTKVMDFSKIMEKIKEQDKKSKK